jgi:hypothetical protein
MKTRQEIINFLENLVHTRLSMEQLNQSVSEFFGTKVEVINVTEENLKEGNDDELSDYNLMFNIEDGTDQSGFYDIYMLPMRREGFDGGTMYITEVGYEFI